jgi:predicted PurR-regulated permease PerM
VAPVSAIGYFSVSRLVQLVQDVTRNVESVQSLLNQISQFLSRFPLLQNLDLQISLSRAKIMEFIQRFGSLLLEWAGRFIGNFALVLLQIFIYLYSLFFFLKEGDRMIGHMTGLLPLQKQYQQEVNKRFVSVTRATLKSTFVIGGVQGLMGGLALYLLGLKGALLWDVLMVFLAIIPNAGTMLIWLPASIMLFAQGRPAAGGVMILAGLLIALVDYVLRPRLIGRDIQMHQILVLLGVMGGIALFGVFGFIIGPIMVALFVILWELFRHAVLDVETD